MDRHESFSHLSRPSLFAPLIQSRAACDESRGHAVGVSGLLVDSSYSVSLRTRATVPARPESGGSSAPAESRGAKFATQHPSTASSPDVATPAPKSATRVRLH